MVWSKQRVPRCKSSNIFLFSYAVGMECKTKKGTRRKKGREVGRIYYAHPASGEHFYLRVLLNFVKGCTSFESIRIINGVDYKTYREASYAWGLLIDDNELNDCLLEADQWASGNELRNLSVTILIHCKVSDPHMFWENNYKILLEYITLMKRKRLHHKDLQLTDKQIEAYSLLEIENMLIK